MQSRFKKGMVLELVDKNKLSRMRICRIMENIGGRLRLKYENAEEFDDFWCHQSSELIHPIGWSSSVGHDILASDGPCLHTLVILNFNFLTQTHFNS